MNSGDLNNLLGNEGLSSTPSVFIDGTLNSDISCIAVEDNFGIAPSKAVLRFGSPHQDINGPITMNAQQFNFIAGARVGIIDENNIIVFAGNLLKRQDQGSQNNIIWTSLDDKVFLKQIYMRGALVLNESGANSIKYIRRFDPRVNPDGYWNCVGANDPFDSSKIVPVFSSKAIRGKVYQTPDLTAPAQPQLGVVIPWTPRLWLQYCQLCTRLDSTSGVQGIVDFEWRSLTNCDRLSWDLDSITSMVGSDVPTSQDPLDRKLPDIQFRGERMLLSINKVLDAAGTHDLRLDYYYYFINESAGTTVQTRSKVAFMPVAFSAVNATSDSTNTYPVNIQHSGQLNSTDTIYDFDISDDYEDIAESALIDGAIIHSELSITNDATQPNGAINCIKLTWTYAQEASFLVGINGGFTIQPNQFAKYPPVQGADYTIAPYSTWLTADGNAGRPLAIARTEDAANLLWGHFPYVYRAIHLDSTAISDGGGIDGFDGRYSDTSIYPVLEYSRPILDKQLQFYVNNPQNGTNIANWLKDQYPIRIQVQREDGKYTEVPKTLSIKTSGEGLIWIEGIQWSENKTPHCIWNGDLETEPCDPAFVNNSNGASVASRMRKIIMNVVIPMDHRLMGTDIVDPNDSVLSKDYRNQLNGPPLVYVDSPNAYHEDHQINSSPAAIVDFYGGVDGTETLSSPLNRLLPPGSESSYANYAAQRKLYGNKIPNRISMYRLVGIRTEFRAGMWLDQITIINPINPGDVDFTVNAPISSVLHDYMAQSSTLGGILNASTRFVGSRPAGPGALI